MMTRKQYDLRDGQLSVLHFGDMSKPLELVFLHANGFNAQSYRRILSELDVHAVAFDMRGHGQSRDMPQNLRMKNWHVFRDDCVEFFDHYAGDMTDGLITLAGHSFGAVSGILAAPHLKGRLAGYVGFDPVSVPMMFRLTSALPGGRAYMKRRVPIARNAGRRKSVFESPEAAFERYQGRGAFRGVPDEVLKDYIAGGLIERADGHWELACRPDWEQTIFVAQWHNLFKAARSLPKNSKIIYAGGRPPVSTKGTRAAVQTAQPEGEVVFHATLGHLFPLQDPDMATRILLENLGRK